MEGDNDNIMKRLRRNKDNWKKEKKDRYNEVGKKVKEQSSVGGKDMWNKTVKKGRKKYIL